MQKVFDIIAQVSEIEKIVDTPVTQVYIMTIDGCEEIAASAKPGQFVMVWPEPKSVLHILGRPFCIAFSRLSKGQIETIFKTVGWGTNELAQKKPGDIIKVRGPLGNSWKISSDTTDVLLIAGGTGIAALADLIEACRQSENIRVTHIFIGAKTANELVLPTKISRFRYIDLHLATEDGSRGFKGLVTAAAQEFLYSNSLRKPYIFAAGPRAMLGAVAEIACQNDIPGQVSMEAQMACGMGACYGCAIAVYDEDSPMGWTYERVCKDGPVFPIGKIVWEVKKMRLKMGPHVDVSSFTLKICFATGLITEHNGNVITIHCPAGTEEKTLEVLHEKIGLQEADYTLL